MKTIQKIAALFLSVIFLLFSFGFTINKMVCLKSGKMKVSLSNIKDCCSMESKTAIPVVKAHCCDINSTAFHLNDYNPSQQYSMPVVVHYTLPLNQKEISFGYYWDKTLKLIAANLPPPIYGKQLLSFISVFVI